MKVAEVSVDASTFLKARWNTVESSWTVIENDKSSWSWSTGDSWTLFSVNSWSVLCKQWQKLLIPFIHFLFNSRWSCLEVLWPSSDRRADHWFEVIYCLWRFLLGEIEHFTSTSAFLCSPAVLMGGLTLQGLVVGHLSQCLIDGEDWQWNWLESKQKPLRGIEAFSTRYPQHRFFRHSHQIKSNLTRRKFIENGTKKHYDAHKHAQIIKGTKKSCVRRRSCKTDYLYCLFFFLKTVQLLLVLIYFKHLFFLMR